MPSQERKIAPLPLRSRSSGNPGRSPNVLNHHGTPPQNSSSETNQSLSTASGNSNRRRSYQSPDNTTDARHLSPPAPDVPGIVSQFGQPVSSSETFTYRLLHNVTPRPSPEPEDNPVSSSQDSPTRLNNSSLPNISTTVHEISQPLHTLYSDEKIAIPSADDPAERRIPQIVEDHSDVAAGTPHTSSSRPAIPLSLNQASDLNPSPSGSRQRSISDASIVSDNNDSPNPYDVRDEEAPLEPFFTSAFQTTLQNGLGIANKIVTAIESLVDSSEPSGDLERLFKDAKRLRTFQSSDTRTIAVLGDSGEGNYGQLQK
jgi:hypothetical protein